MTPETGRSSPIRLPDGIGVHHSRSLPIGHELQTAA